MGLHARLDESGEHLQDHKDPYQRIKEDRHLIKERESYKIGVHKQRV